MKTVGVREAKTHLSRLIDQAVKGEPFVIAKGGTPMVKVMAIDTPSAGQQRRWGFMAGHGSVPMILIAWVGKTLRVCLRPVHEVTAGYAPAAVGSDRATALVGRGTGLIQ